MFETINTLRDLNAARVQESMKDNADLLTINNAYNEARQRILSERKSYKQCTRIVVKARECAMHSSIPIAGHCPVANTIQLTQKGFLY